MGLTKDALRPRPACCKQVGCLTRETEWGEERRSSPRETSWGIGSWGLLSRGASGLRDCHRTARVKKTQLGPGWIPSWEEAARREAASLLRAADGRVSKVRDGCVSAMPAGMRSRRSDRRTPTDWWVRTRRKVRAVPCFQRARRSTPTAEPMSHGRSDQLQATRPCPAGEGISSNRQTSVQRRKRSTPNRRTGVLRMKDQRQLQPPDVGRERRAYHSAAAAFPRGRPGESESSSGHARATGTMHPGFYGRKPWKKPNSTLIIAAPGAAKEGLQRPFQRFRQNRSQKLTANPPPLAARLPPPKPQGQTP